MISVNILESDQQIASMINKGIAGQVNKQMNKRSSGLIRDIKRAVGGWVRSQPEIASLLAQGVPSSLNSQFGLYSGVGGVVESIVSSVVKTTTISVKKVDEKLNGKIIFEFQPSTFVNLLNLPSGHIVTDNGVDLHWLNWLLIQGDKIIVVGYKYEPSSKGRSGGGSMTKGGSFRVPPEFSGNRNNNFITRAFSGRHAELTKLLSGVFK